MYQLPEGYSEIRRVNLQENTKLAVMINVLCFFVAVVMMLLGFLFVPINFAFGSQNLYVLAAFMGSLILYFVFHELIHGLFIKIFSGQKAKYGFAGLFVYAGSDAYFNKRQYIVIGAAPVVLFGALFLCLNLFLTGGWFWFFYILQTLNIAGSVGDLYLIGLMTRMPADVLTHDKGIDMIIYSKSPGSSL
ncbi:MAG: DUF3267 domain-containing protein [Peptococcaceae bacterium]|nr:DUF3267 domain-containing protein [Peptococcaceae bacterium]